MRAFQPLGPGQRRVAVGDGVWEIVTDEPDYVGLRADLDELEATDPAVAAAAKSYDEAVPEIVNRVLRATRKGDIDVLAQLLWDTNAESMGWIDCYKNAEAIVLDGWRR